MNSIATPLAEVKRVIPAALVPVLAVAAGAIHLAHNYLPMGMPGDAAAGPPPGAGAPAGDASGLMSLVMPHLSQIMLLNFVGFVGLAIAFVIAIRRWPRLRVPVDALLVLMSAATLYAWNAMGQSNPYGTGTLALIVEAGLIVFAVADAALATSGRAGAHQARPAIRRQVS